MLNNNHKNLNCAFAEPLISYLYGESGAAEKAEFEAHLKTCASCHIELTKFGFTRSAVHEWRVEEFDKLATPVIELPSSSIKTQTVATDSRSWFSDWRQIFSFKLALAMSALAIAVVLVGVTFMALNFRGDNIDVAEKTANDKVIKTAVSPTVEKTVEPPKQTVDTNKFAAPDLPVKIVNQKTAAPKSPAIKVSANAPKNNSDNVVPVRAGQNTNKGNQKFAAVPKSKIPSLTDSEDEEDNSVRLADLFDEIETK
ncbi:MAG: zf-HC2 domain-containing protein [Pyrinomonadaceae bacterium]|nr:zf-HC2 domain-containing protein [Pyrinomonadaceae bacterium]